MPLPPPAVGGDSTIVKAASKGEPYQIIIFGFFGSNRRLDAFLEAFHRFPQREKFHVHVAGMIPNEEAIASRVKKLRLDKLVTLRGSVSDSQLDAALRSSDQVVA